MEIARFITAAPRERLYLGHPCCGAWLNAPERFKPPERPFTLVVPPLAEARFRRFAEWLRGPALWGGGPEIELSLNDWGTLSYCSETVRSLALPWRLAAGVLLAEQHTDPLLARFLQPGAGRRSVWCEGKPAELEWRAPPPSLVEHWRMPGIFTKAGLLRELGVTRVELCAQLLPWPERGPGLPVSVYRRALLSVIPCRAASRNAPGPEAEDGCMGCTGGELLTERGGKTLHREHNLIWYEAEIPAPEWADRLVECSAG
jgi:hypothetical protein